MVLTIIICSKAQLASWFQSIQIMSKLNISQIKAPIASEMKLFEKRFHEAMKSKVALLDRIMTFIVKYKGKQIRPMFVFLSAGTCGGISDKTYRGASLIELLHTATLIHDDVVDDSFKRRGFFSVNALWKNKVAVLVGDYLLSRGLLLSLDHDDFQLLKLTSSAVRAMSEGELLQIEQAKTLKITEKTYFDIIRMKTASLIAACCAVGAATTTDDQEQIEKMRHFGEKIGIAFQIKDDLFDYGEDKIGKPTGIDIKERKLTLPIIHALSQVSSGEQKRIKQMIRQKGDQKKAVREIVDFVYANGGIDYAKKRMFTYQQEAFDLLEDIPESAHKEALINLVKFTTERKK